MTTLKTKVLGIEFENPFILASAPPTAKIESIDKAFALFGAAKTKLKAAIDKAHNVLIFIKCLPS